MKSLSSIVPGLFTVLSLGLSAHATAQSAQPPAEVRGTWLTTTANDAIASPANSAATMRRLREIGLNTVFVETWKNGYTQYPSRALKGIIGVDRRPALMPQDPSDKPGALKAPGRDLLGETLIEAHRQGLLYIAWFEYGFMAAHKNTDNHLRRMKPEWLSRDASGNEVAPNGFVWMNPLHPEARRFLLDLVLEAVDAYDLDGIQLDDRIVWPYYTMGYDDYTKKIYAQEHNGASPPADPKDPAWMRWRAEKVNEYSKMFVQEIRARRPGLIISLSPAVYPWCYENYLLEWPTWAAWTSADALKKPEGWPGNAVTPRWDEFIPQVYRMNYPAFERTWLEQVGFMKSMGAGRVSDLIAGIRVVGDGPDSTWDDLRKSMELVRSTGGGGHVHWFSRGVLDLYPQQLTEFYAVASKGHAPHPMRPADWRPAPRVLEFVQARRIPAAGGGGSIERGVWSFAGAPDGRYRVIARTDAGWQEIARLRVALDAPKGQTRGFWLTHAAWQPDFSVVRENAEWRMTGGPYATPRVTSGSPFGKDLSPLFRLDLPTTLETPEGAKPITSVELLIDRREEMSKAPGRSE